MAAQVSLQPTGTSTTPDFGNKSIESRDEEVVGRSGGIGIDPGMEIARRNGTEGNKVGQNKKGKLCGDDWDVRARLDRYLGQIQRLSSNQVHIDALKPILKRWTRTGSPAFLIYNLQPKYRKGGLAAQRLNGSDKLRVQCLMQLQQELGLRLCLVGLEKTVSGYCETEHILWDSGSNGECCGMDQVTGHSLKFGPVVGIDGHVLARQLVVHDDEDEDEDEDKEEDHHQVQADYFGRRKPDKWTHHHDTENGGPGITYWYMNLAFVIVPEKKWVDFILDTASNQSMDDFRPLLDSELSRHASDPGDTQTRANCGKICKMFIVKHGRRSPWDEIQLVFRGCVAADKEALARRLFRKYPRSEIKEVLEIVEQCKAIEWTKLAASVIAELRCSNAEDFSAIVNISKGILPDDLLVGPILAKTCDDEPSVFTIFKSCMDMGRVDLASAVIRKFPKSLPSDPRREPRHSAKSTTCSPLSHRSAAASQKIILSLLIASSADYSFGDWLECVEALFQGYENIVDCHLALRQLSDIEQIRNMRDSSDIRDFQRRCWEHALQNSPALSEQDISIVARNLNEQGSAWMTDIVLPIAIEKIHGGNIAFALSMWRLRLDSLLSVQVFSTLAPLAVSLIDLSQPFKRSHGKESSKSSPTSHQTIEYTAHDLVSFGKRLGAPGLPEDLQRDFKDGILRKCKAIPPRHAKQLRDLLESVMERFGTVYSTWIVDILQAYIICVLGKEPEHKQPESWYMPQDLGCMCKVCISLDLFLKDPKQQANSFSRPVAITDHVVEVLLRANRNYQEALKFDIIRCGERSSALLITKRNVEYDRIHATWVQKAERAKRFLRSLDGGFKQRLQTVLGTSYDDIVELKIVSLERSDIGEPLPGRYQAQPRWKFGDPSQTSEVSSASAGVEQRAMAVHKGSLKSSSSTGTKRKAADSAGEKALPHKRGM